MLRSEKQNKTKQTSFLTEWSKETLESKETYSLVLFFLPNLVSPYPKSHHFNLPHLGSLKFYTEHFMWAPCYLKYLPFHGRSFLVFPSFNLTFVIKVYVMWTWLKENIIKCLALTPCCIYVKEITRQGYCKYIQYHFSWFCP